MFKRTSVIFLLALIAIAPAFAAQDAAGPSGQTQNVSKEIQPDQTEMRLKQAIAADPEVADGYRHLALFYLSRQRAGEAVEQFQEAIIRDPEDARLFVGIAIAYLHQQSYGMAQAMVSRALELNPKLANARKLSEYVDAKQRLVSEAHGGEQPLSTSRDAEKK